ncbi:glycosyltransferase family 4 protein [Calothrix sp. 336/3]|uniref:glycosyltransferase family 4 protein n=1 Tax=Calothrix sp. 336/3 TaxID=1337936 RepID=UPI0004E36B9B|nr:glycosyltransferase family 4 protein [Calothrix sp. 336/3]AKG23265.1 glycosyl transferase [Calothrix sp. 336/3]
MKICIVTPYVMKGDGQGRVNYEIVWGAIRRGHHLTLVCKKIAPELQMHPQVTWIHFDIPNYPAQLLSEIAFSRKSAAWLKEHRQEFDIVKVCGAVTSAACDVNVAHFIHSAWLKSPVHTARVNKNIYGLYHWLYSALNAYWEKQIFPRAKVAIAVSDKIRQELITEVGLPEEQVRVIINGVDTEEFVPGNRSRQEYGLPENVTMGLFAGDIRTNRKNLDTILKALVQVPEMHLAVAGNTTDSPYPALAQELGISDRVHFLGFRRDIAQIMQAVDCFIFPSRYEACTLVMLEAMASGLPVITATSAGGAELVTSECGFVLSNSDDIAGLAAAMSQLQGDRQLREQMSLASRRVAEQNTWANMADNYIQLFEELATVNSPTPAVTTSYLSTTSIAH